MKCNLPLPKIGIIGGAGPVAGALLFNKIIAICQQRYRCQRDADFPYMLLLNYPFDEMLENVSAKGKRERLQGQLRQCFTTLMSHQIEIAAIACNTLHEFLDLEASLLKKEKNLSFIHMIEQTALALKQAQIKQSLILCSETSAKYQLHKRYFNCSYPVREQQLQVQGIIDSILAGKQTQREAKKVVHLLNRQLKTLLDELPLKSEERVGVVLGCTEFSVLNEQFSLPKLGLDERLILFDPNQIVADKICSMLFLINNN